MSDVDRGWMELVCVSGVLSAHVAFYDRCVLVLCVCVCAQGILNAAKCNHGVGLKTKL